MEKFSEFQDPIREYVINEILQNYIYTKLLNEEASLKAQLSKTNSKTDEKKYNKLLQELKEVSSNIDKIKNNKSKNYSDIIYRRFIDNIKKAHKTIKINEDSFEELISKYLDILSSDKDESDKVLKHLDYVKNKLASFINIVPETTQEIKTEKKPEEENKTDKEQYLTQLEKIQKELDILSYNEKIDPNVIDTYKTTLTKISEKSQDISVKNKVDELIILLENIKNKKDDEKSKTSKSNEMTGGGNLLDLNNDGFYYNTFKMLYGGADNLDEQKKFADKEFESMEKKFGDNLDKKDDDMDSDIDDDKDERKDSEDDKDERKDSEDDKDERKDSEDDKDERKDSEDDKDESKDSEDDKDESKDSEDDKDVKKKKKRKKKKRMIANIDNEDEIIDEIDNDEKIKIISKIQDIKNNLSTNSRHITKYYEEADNGLISKTKEFKSFIKNIDLFENKNKITSNSEFKDYLSAEKEKLLEYNDFIDKKIIDVAFNDSDGLFKSLDNIENGFDEFKKLVTQNKDAIKLIFKDNNNSKIELVQFIDTYLNKLDDKFRKNLNTYYQNLKDVSLIFKNLLKEVEKILNDFKTDYNKLIEKREKDKKELENKLNGNRSSLNLNNYGMNNDINVSSEFSNSDYGERQREFKKKIEEVEENYKKDSDKLINEYNTKINDTFKKENNNLNYINNKLNIEKSVFDNYKYNIYDNLFKKLTSIEYKLQDNKIQKKAENNFITDDGNDANYNPVKPDNIFSTIWNKYVTSKKRNIKTKEEIDDDFYNSVKANDLNPDKVLEISSSDKVIFIVLIFVIRQIALIITNYFIDVNIIKSFNVLIIIYITIYMLLLSCIIIFVNLDSYKMRILFNYINLHINYYGICTHYFTFLLFIFIIYLYLKNTDKNLIEGASDKLNDSEKLDYKYKLSTLSLIVFLFTSITDYLL
jgi:hypothetical protein